MDSGPNHQIPQAALLILEDAMVQLGQATMELKTVRGEWLFYFSGESFLGGVISVDLGRNVKFLAPANSKLKIL